MSGIKEARKENVPCINCKHLKERPVPSNGSSGTKSLNGTFDQGWLGHIFTCGKHPGMNLTSIPDLDTGELIPDVGSCEWEEEI